MTVNIKEQLDAICEIAEIDKKIFQIARLKSELPNEIAAMKRDEENLLMEQDEIKNKILHEQQFIKNEEKEILEKRDFLNNLENQKSSIANSKEFAAVSKTIELNSLEIQLSEKKIRNAKVSIDNLHEKLKNLDEAIENMSIVLHSKVSNLEMLLNNSEKEEVVLNEKRLRVSEKIVKEVLSRYDRVRGVNKSGMGASYIDRGACGSCFMVIPLQQQIDVSVCRIENQMHRCDYCGSILMGVSLENIGDQGYSSRYSEDDHTFSSRGV